MRQRRRFRPNLEACEARLPLDGDFAGMDPQAEVDPGPSDPLANIDLPAFPLELMPISVDATDPYA